MIDKKKRQTLKGIVAVAGATAAASIPAFASAGSLSESAISKEKTIRQVWPPVAVKSPIKLSTRVSALNNDIEFVMSNNSNKPVTVTQMTPSQLGTPRGTFDLDNMLNKGPLHLAAGESVSVQLQRHAINGSSDNALEQLMRTGLCITTDADQFTGVSYAGLA